MSKHTREELVYLAKLAEQCERYDGKSINKKPYIARHAKSGEPKGTKPCTTAAVANKRRAVTETEAF